MSYRRDGDRITLEMSVVDYECLLFGMGIAIGAHDRMGGPFPWHLVAVVNRMNEGNPHFTQYDIPPKEEDHG